MERCVLLILITAPGINHLILADSNTMYIEICFGHAIIFLMLLYYSNDIIFVEGIVILI